MSVGRSFYLEPPAWSSADIWESLRKAQDLRLKSVAFPLISTGIYGYPKDEAVRIAIKSIREFFEDNPHTSLQQVTLVAYSGDDLQLINSNL